MRPELLDELTDMEESNLVPRATFDDWLRQVCGSLIDPAAIYTLEMGDPSINVEIFHLHPWGGPVVSAVTVIELVPSKDDGFISAVYRHESMKVALVALTQDLIDHLPEE